MGEINDRFYELLNDQTEEMYEPDSHPYDVNWAMYDELQSPSREGSDKV